MAAHDALDSILDDQRKEARSEAERHIDDDPRDPAAPDIDWHRRGCRCPDCADLRGPS